MLHHEYHEFRLFAEGSVIPPEHRLMLVNFHRECIGDTKKAQWDQGIMSLNPGQIKLGFVVLFSKSYLNHTYLCHLCISFMQNYHKLAKTFAKHAFGIHISKNLIHTLCFTSSVMIHYRWMDKLLPFCGCTYTETPTFSDSYKRLACGL